MTQDGKSKRGFERFQLPVVIEAPGLSEVPLVPEDIGAGGFGVVLAARPGQGQVVDCILQVSGDVFRDCRAKVMWVREDDSESGAWKAGLAVELTGEARARLEGLLQDLRLELPKVR